MVKIFQLVTGVILSVFLIWSVINKGGAISIGDVLLFIVMIYFIYDGFKQEEMISKINALISGELIVGSFVFIYFTIKFYYLIGIIISSYLFL